MIYIGTPGHAPCGERILARLRSTGPDGCSPKELAKELYGDVTPTNRVHVIVGSLRKKGHAIISKLVITKAGKEVRYVLTTVVARKEGA